MEFLYQIDLFLFKFINQTAENSVFDQVMPAVTDLHLNRWFSVPVLIILLAVFVRKYQRMGITYFLFLILAVSTSDFTGAKVKRIVQRPRPFQNIEAQAIQRSPAGKNNSFYSNHASKNVTFATLMSFAFPSARITLFAIAGLISFSRVYNGVHYPIDIFCGALAGLFWGWIFYTILQKIIFNFRKKSV